MATLATASSKVTVATAPALASLTSTALTPETRNSVLFTIGSQVALSTFSTTVFSAACTVQGESAIATVAAAARRRIMEHSFGLEVRSEEQGRKLREAERDDDEDGRRPKSDLRNAAGAWLGAIGAIGTGNLRLSVDEIEAVAKETGRDGGENRLIGCKSGQVADPCAADPEHE